MAKRVLISKKDLVRLYKKDMLNTFQIADKLGCCQSSVWKKLKEFKIKSRPSGVKRVNLPKKLLERLYLRDKLSTWKIESKLGIPRGTIHRKLKEYEIPTRDLATANVIYSREDFSGDLIEKAYLIGFRLGDLGVRKIWPNSKTICVASGSTIKEQIELIKDLFDPYCRVWIKKSKNGKINIQASLNESFNFLLSKEIPFELLDNEKTFFSFLAGFIDAEGHIGVHNKMASFNLGNYDFKLLKLIKKNLFKYGINCNKLIFDKRKGKTNNQGYKYNSNYCQLGIHRKDELMNFFAKIALYIRHKKKVKALNIAIENINKRNKRKMEGKNFQISTAIDYPSGKFHLGHAYEKICADVIARWKRSQGFNVHFSTGTDCHGLKIEKAAEKVGKPPKRFVEEISEGFKELCKVLNISYDDFIMTLEDRHKKTAISILKKLEKNGDIYRGDYEGLYCVDCETYYTERESEGGCCPIHKSKLEKIKERSYFFKLSKYQDKIIGEINKNNLIWPNKKKKEILNRLKEPLRDLSISREKVKWGIPLPFDSNMTIFVWVEALINYLTTVDYPNKKFKEFWPATHIIGSDIVWHHSAIWFSILSSLKIKLPKVVVHGFINLNGEKLSKARGITIDPIDLANKYSPDSLRYFLMRKIPFGEDGDFSEESLKSAHNDELANKLGNLVSRVAGLIERNGLTKTENKLIKKLKLREIEKHFDNYEFDKALNEIFAFIDICNEYVQTKKPWETGDGKILYELKESILKIARLLWPFIPSSSEKITKQFSATKIKKGEILFKKISK